MVVLVVEKRAGGRSVTENGQLVVLVFTKQILGRSVLEKLTGGRPAL